MKENGNLLEDVKLMRDTMFLIALFLSLAVIWKVDRKEIRNGNRDQLGCEKLPSVT